ncbi:DUF4307 domain-containing protein [Corynebacterium mastitidis]|uniref:DUF4307 domain-containing protein n=2 Tax=Corynebacterium TaxID=1716 RepID=A0A0Q0UDC3_9CORY|nr:MULTISPECIES: DUF4307 domain-containing protein [Corynebacterium]KQB85897.1 hypothetical protein Clow_01637 [Corynebacterium lowii]MCH6196422.1 DUF4307 domain-containing protein [Corynebacterium mastitidis]MDK8451296.1 DUF4307 domain-containing protein [Corynebacterium mastitidis]MDP9850676.1 hypothetical protein [Corynebacterium lowii]PKF69189.1 DUF4307 domain-containing protein [Corynebacterium mastitidis]
MASQPFERPRSRYGAARPTEGSKGLSGKVIAVLMVVLLIAFVIVVARYLSTRDEPTVKAAMTNFERVDDATMHLDIDVTRSQPGVPSYCIVTAMNYDKAEVGRREVLIPAGGPETQRLAVEIPTRDRAVSGSVYGCSTQIPSYMDL